MNLLQPGRRYRLRFDVEFARTITAVRCGMMIRTTTGVEVGGAVSAADGHGVLVDAGERCSVSLEFDCRMQPGTYFVNAGVVGRPEIDEVFLDRLVDVLMILRISRERERRAEQGQSKRRRRREATHAERRVHWRFPSSRRRPLVNGDGRLEHEPEQPPVRRGHDQALPGDALHFHGIHRSAHPPVCAQLNTPTLPVERA
ncbi:MAG: hypothetical protein HC788_02480 [Sphingopyxis sp.]|nr:hypothetical protein [Sphingopyxis sp.]